MWSTRQSKIALTFLWIAWSTLSMALNQQEAGLPVNTQSYPLLVKDSVPDNTLKRYRRTTDSQSQKDGVPINWYGLDKLSLSASAQVSDETLPIVTKGIQQPIILVDLREESHGFVNGIPISWYAEQNAVNRGLLPQKIIEGENSLLNKLTKKLQLGVHQVIEKSTGVIQKSMTEMIPVKHVESEKQFATRHQLGYQRFYIRDHNAPTPYQVGQILDWYQQVSKQTWLHIHCRGGAGRSTTVMSMIDMINHSKEVSFNEIIERQSLLGGRHLGKISLTKEKSWKSNLAQERYKFIQNFYDYTRYYDSLISQTWNDWLQLQETKKKK